jgi:DNA-binding PadR family transcriptional regulator
MALGTLASHGPQHGHQIRLSAEVTNVGEWGGVSVGALYRELKQMAAEGAVTEVRTEKVGRRPARTIYAITDQGRLELAMLRERAIKHIHVGPDPLGVALLFSGQGDDPEAFSSWLSAREGFLRVALQELTSERERLVARGYADPLQAIVMRRGELVIRAELEWHEELAQTLAEMRRDGVPGGPPRQPGAPRLADASGPGGSAEPPARRRALEPGSVEGATGTDKPAGWQTANGSGSGRRRGRR